MSWVITVQPTVEPVTVDELRTHLRLDDSSFDIELTRLITAARKSCEAYTNRQFISATYAYSFDYWPFSTEITIPVGPLSSVTSVTYYDANGVSQTFDSSNYQVDTTALFGTITLTYTATYPILQMGKKNAVTITFVAGYGATAASVPENIKQGILVLAAHWFENASSVTSETVNEVPQHIQWMLNPDVAPVTY